MAKKFVKGLEGIAAAETNLSKIDGLKGELIYRGYSIFDLAEKSSFEEVVYLLWNAKLPNKKNLNKFKKELNKNMTLNSSIKKMIQSFPKSVVPMSGLRTIVSALSLYDSDSQDISEKANKRKAIRIMASMPSIVAGIQRRREGKKIVNPKKNLSLAGNFLYMLKGKIPSKEEEKTLDVALILHAEHGMNASTFASRVTVATLSDLHSGMVSAISTLKGPLHGGANKKAIQTLHLMEEKLGIKKFTPSSQHEIDLYVESLLKKHIRIMGIGHRVYKVKDPRAKIFEEYAKKISKKELKYFKIAKEIEKVMAEQKHLYPNIDFFSGIVYEDLKINRDLYVCIFALSRTAGWIAHMLEQYSDNRLIRPTAIYKGPLNKKYIAIGKRG